MFCEAAVALVVTSLVVGSSSALVDGSFVLSVSWVWRTGGELVLPAVLTLSRSDSLTFAVTRAHLLGNGVDINGVSFFLAERCDESPEGPWTGSVDGRATGDKLTSVLSCVQITERTLWRLHYLHGAELDGTHLSCQESHSFCYHKPFPLNNLLWSYASCVVSIIFFLPPTVTSLLTSSSWSRWYASFMSRIA